MPAKLSTHVLDLTTGRPAEGMVIQLLRTGREQEALLELEEALMADHATHDQLLSHFPEVMQMPQVVHLLELYRR